MTRTVLIVDDTPANIGVIAENLEQNGYRVLVAQDGEEGLERAAFVQPDLILLDVMMPHLDGFEVCRRLKKQAATRDIPVIFMTARAENDDKLNGFKAGAVDYVTKPLHIDEVIARIDTQLALREMHKRFELQNAQLLRYREQLEQRVAERTAELAETNRRLLAEIYERKRTEKILAAREQEFRTLAENAPDNICRYDLECRRIYMNPKLETTLEILAQDMLGKTPSESAPDDPQARSYQNMIAEVIRTGTAGEFELTLQDREGRVRHDHISFVAERDSDGKIIGVLAIGRDITEIKRQKAQEEIRLRIFERLAQGGELNEILELVVRFVEQSNPNLLSSIMLSDAQGTHLLSSVAPSLPDDYMSAIDGISIGEGVGSCGTAAWRGETVIAADLLTHPLWANYKDLALQFGLASCWSEPILDSAGKVLGTFGIYQREPSSPDEEDMLLIRRASHLAAIAIARKKTERLLHERAQAIRAVVENSPDIIARYDRQCRRTYINPAMQTQLGVPADEILGKTPLEITALHEVQTYMELIRSVLNNAQEAHMELSFCDNEGCERWGHMRLVPEFGTDGRVASVLAITRDISERKLAEQALEKSRAQLRGLTARREEAREQERKYIAREVHDELGQILTGLQLNVLVLTRRFAAESEPLKEQLQETMALTDKALSVARNVASALRPAALDMGVASALEWLAGRFMTNTGIHCEVHIDDMDIQMEECCAIALFRIVQESLTNVSRHARADRVDITLGMVGRDYLLKVRDNGAGFDANEKKMDSYGLVGIQERALLLDGTVSINSHPGFGTEIVVSVPVNNNSGNL